MNCTLPQVPMHCTLPSPRVGKPSSPAPCCPGPCTSQGGSLPPQAAHATVCSRPSGWLANGLLHLATVCARRARPSRLRSRSRAGRAGKSSGPSSSDICSRGSCPTSEDSLHSLPISPSKYVSSSSFLLLDLLCSSIRPCSQDPPRQALVRLTATRDKHVLRSLKKLRRNYNPVSVLVVFSVYVCGL